MITRDELFNNELKGLYDDSPDKVSKQDTGVSFNRTNARPIDWTTIFPSFNAASAWAANGTNAYPGHVLQVVDTEGVKVYKVQLDGTLSQIDAAIEPGDLPISAGVGIAFGTQDGKTTINAKLKEGNGLTADDNGYLSVQQLALDTAVDSTTSGSTAVPYTSAVWAAISANATSAQASSIAEAVLKNAVSGKIANGAAASTLTAIGYDSETSALCGAYAPISITSAQVTDLSNQLCAISANTLSAANDHADAISNALCGQLSNIVAKGVTFGGVYGTSADVTALTAAIPGQVFVLTGDDYNGKEYICTSTDGVDGIGPGHPIIVEVGDEGTIGTIATNLEEVSGKVDNKVILSTYGTPGTSSTIEKLQINRMTAAEYASLTSKADDQLYVITDEEINAFGERILSVGTPISGTDAANKDYVDSQITDLTSQFDGKVALSTISDVSSAISGAISTSLSLGDLAHKDTVGTSDIDDGAVTSAKIALSSVTRDHLSGWFVLSCGDAVQDGDIRISDVYSS